MNIKRFYTSLEAALEKMRNERLRNQFHLLPDVAGRSIEDIREEIDALMVLLAREFIQHVVAENAVLLQQAEEERKEGQGAEGRRTGRRAKQAAGAARRRREQTTRQATAE